MQVIDNSRGESETIPPKSILFLPDAGPNNPFQYLMIDLLKQEGYTVNVGSRKRFLATYTAVKVHKPDIIYFDWIQSFVLGKTMIMTILKMLSFYLELQYLILIKKIPFVHTLHNIDNHAGRWIYFERVIYTYFLKRCKRIRVYSESTKNKIISIFNLKPDKIFIIQDVPYHFFYPNQATLAQGRELLGVTSENFVYLFLGMIKPYKGLEDLIEAFKEVASKEDLLIIAGASDNKFYETTIQALVQDFKQIIFHNQFIEVEKVQHYYKACNVVVLPFKNIEHSGSVDLAMSFAKPLITLKTPVLEKTLKHQEALLYEDKQDLKVKLKLAKLLDLSKLGQVNFKIADSYYYKDLLLLFK